MSPVMSKNVVLFFKQHGFALTDCRFAFGEINLLRSYDGVNTVHIGS